MYMLLGSFVNGIAIVAGGLLGLLLKKGIRESCRDTIMNAVALVVMIIGISGAIKAQELVLMIACLCIGGLIGEGLHIEEKLNRFGVFLGSKLTKSGNNFSKGFVNASLIYCIGSMAIVGSLESGLTNTHQTLFIKAILDGISGIFFASAMGSGVLLSAVPCFLYEGLLTVGAFALKSFLTDAMITEIAAIGSVLIIAMGFNMLNLKQIKIGNMLPSIFLPLIYYAVRVLVFHA